ncbi:glycosyltransferase [Propioniciclava soli]|uniref:Erythromycin biosynthesis protein CIII-like C-terminal domain-containing protein n=1 Tax=Propioniciclava soli TaxID=2775081 RepID=A0ABZ3CDR8_9ACTN|nr:nucleotide disphospho-sugar-binding domain-containing protein [Propioniciclava soli]
MATFLFATTPVPAHTWNAQTFAAGLTAAGHRVVWYAGDAFARDVARTGAEFRPFRRATQPTTRGLDQLNTPLDVLDAFRSYFIGDAAARASDLTSLIHSERPDALFTESLCFGAGLAAEAAGLPWASFGDGPLMYAEADTPPFGSGLPFRTEPRHLRRNRVVSGVVRRGMRPARRSYDRARADAGLPPQRGPVLQANQSPHLHLHAAVPGFEYPRAHLPAHVHFIGAIQPFRPEPFEPPPGWAELVAGRRRLAVITQGTLRDDPRELIRPALRALARLDVDVLVLTSRPSEAPPGVTAAYVPYEQALPHASVLLTNGGFTGVTMALAHGVPVVQAGVTEEKSDIGARVAWSGAGVRLGTSRPSARAVRRAVRRVLEDPQYATRAAVLQEEFARYDSGQLAITLLEDLIR